MKPNGGSIDIDTSLISMNNSAFKQLLLYLGFKGVKRIIGLRVHSIKRGSTQWIICLTAADRGSWLHRVLELLWQSWRSPEHIDKAKVAVLIQQQVQQVMAHARAVLPRFLTPTLLAVESKRLERLVSKSVALELQRGDFKVEGIEQKIRLLVDDFEFDLRLDRWDSTAEGLVLIDYKTSVPMTSTERLVAPQLILYAMALGQILGLTEAELAQQICEAVYFAMKPSSGVKWINLADEDWFQQERSMLQTLLEEIRSGRAELEPLQGERTCRQCDYQSYCRVGYRRGFWTFAQPCCQN